MRLGEIRAYNAQLTSKLATLQIEKKKISDQISQSVSRNTNTQPLLVRLADLENQTNQLNEVTTQLKGMESLLVLERKDAVDASSSAGGVFVCSLLLIAFDIILFAWLAAASWNWILILIEVGVVVGSAFVLSMVASPRN